MINLKYNFCHVVAYKGVTMSTKIKLEKSYL